MNRHWEQNFFVVIECSLTPERHLMDDKDFVFVNKPLTHKEERKFGDFPKSRKAKTRLTRVMKKEKVLHDK